MTRYKANSLSAPRYGLGTLLVGLALAFVQVPLAGLAHSLEHSAAQVARSGAAPEASGMATQSVADACALCLAFAAQGAKAGMAAAAGLPSHDRAIAIAAPLAGTAPAPQRRAFDSRAPPLMV